MILILKILSKCNDHKFIEVEILFRWKIFHLILTHLLLPPTLQSIIYRNLYIWIGCQSNGARFYSVSVYVFTWCMELAGLRCNNISVSTIFFHFCCLHFVVTFDFVYFAVKIYGFMWWTMTHPLLFNEKKVDEDRVVAIWRTTMLIYVLNC